MVPAVVCVVALALAFTVVRGFASEAPSSSSVSLSVPCAESAAAACAGGSSGPVAFFANGSEFGIAVCAGSVAVACNGAPASVLLLPRDPGGPPLAVSAGYAQASAGRASATLRTADGAVLEVNDTFAAPDANASAAFGGNGAVLVAWSRTLRVVSASSSANFSAFVGVTSRLSLSLLTTATPLDQQLWLAPGLLYGGSQYQPPWAIGGGNRSSMPAIFFREDRVSAPLAALVDPASRTVAAAIRPADTVPNTIFNDTLVREEEEREEEEREEEKDKTKHKITSSTISLLVTSWGPRWWTHA